MLCKHCGKEIDGGAIVCPNCGRPVKGGKACAITGIVFDFLFPVVGFILNIVGLVKGAKSKYMLPVVLGVIGMVIAVVVQVLYTKYALTHFYY